MNWIIHRWIRGLALAGVMLASMQSARSRDLIAEWGGLATSPPLAPVVLESKFELVQPLIVTGTAWQGFVLTSGHDIRTWGDAPEGEGIELTPFFTPGGEKIRYVSLAATRGTVLGLRDDGTIDAWGSDAYGLVGKRPNGPVASLMACGPRYGMAVLKSNRRITVWGNSPPSYLNSTLVGAKALAVGFTHAIAIKSDDTAAAWGRINGAAPNLPTIPGKVKAVAAGDQHGLALDVDGRLYSWGESSKGQRPTSVISGVAAIAARRDVTIAAMSDGTVRVWAAPGSSELEIPGVAYAKAVGLGDERAMAIAPASENDSFETPLVIADDSWSHEIWNLLATREDGEPAHGPAAGSRSVWFTWTAPARGVVRLTAANPAALQFAIYRGNSLAALQRLANSRPVGAASSRPVERIVAAGEQFRIAAEDIPGAINGLAPLSLAFQRTPPNDEFADAQILETQQSVAGTTLGASRESGEPSHGEAGGSRSVWWRWIAPSDGFFTLTREKSSTWQWAAYQGDSLASLLAVSRGLASDTTEETFWIRVFRGQALRLAVECRPGTNPGEFAFHAGFRSSPSNDRRENAIRLSPNPLESIFSVTGGNSNATRDEGEAIHGRPGTNSVWFSWTAPGNGVLTLSDLDPDNMQLAAYSRDGSELGSRSRMDDPAGANRFFPLTFRVSSSESVYVAIESLLNADGSFSSASFDFNLQFTFGPPNDAFAHRRVLNGVSTETEGNLLGARREPGEPDHGVFSSNVPNPATVWFTWTASPDSTLAVRRVRLTASQLGMAKVDLAVYRGESLATLTSVPLPRTELIGTSRHVEFLAARGGTYHIALAGDSHDPQGQTAIDAHGFYKLTLSASALRLADFVTSTSTNSPVRTVRVQGGGFVRNDGNASAGPLRIRFVARAGFGNNFSFGPYTDPNEETALSTVLLNPARLPAGAAASFPIDALCPAPDDDGGYGRGWGVFALLEEQDDGEWSIADARLIATGAWPDPTNGQANIGPGNGAYRYDPGRGLANTPVTLQLFRIEGPAAIVAGGDAAFRSFGTLSNGKVREYQPAWAAGAGMLVNATGTARIDPATPLPAWADLEARAAVGGELSVTSKRINLLPPSPVAVGFGRLAGTLRFGWLAPPGQSYLLQRSTDLKQWEDLGTRAPQEDGLVEVVITPQAQLPTEYFRLRPAP